MATRTDLIQQTLEDLGVVVVGQTIDARNFRSLDTRLKAYLLELDEKRGLDFDPTANDEIPDERLSWLIRLFGNQIAGKYGQAVDYQEVRLAESEFFAAIIGESDFIEDEQRDF